jgi:hypothetical protein
MSCAELRDAASELALEILDGEERAAALAHLSRCASCRHEVALLTEAVEDLLTYAPEVEPPAGFDQHVVNRVVALAAREGADAASNTSRRHRALRTSPVPRVLAAAAVIVLIAAVGLFGLSRLGSGHASPQFAEMRLATGQSVGDVTVSHDRGAIVLNIPDWVGMVRSYGGTVDGPYWVAVHWEDGTQALDRLPVADSPPWTISVGTERQDVLSVAVVDDQGTVWCTARFDA